MKLGILAPESSWHFRDLARAARESKLDTEIHSIDFRGLTASIDGSQVSFFDGDAELEFDVLLVRCMPAGSLQQIIFRMDCLHRFSSSGVRVINSPRSMEIAIDKYLSLALMADAGISVPRFAVCQNVERAMVWFEKLGGDVVLKPIFGSMGNGLRRLTSVEQARHELEEFVSCGEVLYLQKFINHGGYDVRVFVIGDRVFGMRRESDDWRTNVAVGGRASAHEVTSAERRIAIESARANQCEIAGIDLVYEQGRDEPYVLEVNASPGWEAISTVVDADIGRLILEHCLETSSLL